MATLTVFTPAYNRAHTLPRTYASLLAQKCRDFVWLIVDDGSSDDTAELVRGWQNLDNGFEIRYIYQENGGMHIAHNTAYAHINTELNICIDSDDCLAADAVEKILTKWRQVRDCGYAGIIGLDADLEGRLIGKGFPVGMTETTLMGYYAAGGYGDKKLVYRTDVINRYPPYPVFEGERYVALAYKYRLIDQDYKLAVLNEVLCNVEYQADGHSTGMWKEYVRSPKGFAFWRKVCMQYPESKKRLVADCIHYVSSSLIAGDKDFLRTSPRKLLTVLCFPMGAVLSAITMKRAK
ncbi:glycosyltransferase family 2 protein [Anaeromassilibacillus senegalensis]|uniref:Glycosyltransferase family 2 protein n=1 Tax=Anaeromassilibacillus senegalensis TaxID=1673717 RepID=A0ABS9CNH5_9FIRM|nr:glycosyltransferase family 2 protein [Anaeromassilibacillus senegalensis]MCF2652706.1 glycosyltransferase family 2 protein [Anaeromassilibacillus senegalensis]